MSDRDRRYSNRGPRSTSQRGDPRRSRSGPSRSRGGGGRGHPRVFLRNGTIVYLLDILQHGGVDKAGHSWNPICQVMEVPSFNLYEVSLNKQKIQELKLQQKIQVTGREDSPLGRPNKKLKYDQLTHASLQTIGLVLEQYVLENEERFIKFINNVGPITIKRHYLEVLPGVGKKLMNEILENRHRKLFENFEELHTRVPGFKPKEVFVKRIIEELEDEELKHYLFVKRRRPEDRSSGGTPRPRDGSRDGGRRTSRNDSLRKRY
ncbi:hypothetical protein NEF87_002939 [Candidatus Lokiarchaeum ossiferum]|uniref:DUF655 domain-containing protein n=1 Tax=Candidatus Lokiarchaeum ossiferum TaxID=2951803 RepID=A0ABY6HVR9_9ARCH|nr:hypothetical protein NEF87_002939 [Candidatus Lokiarchaeum sp. B-35]